MWHGQGIVLDEYPTSWKDARKKAGIEWEPEERVMYVMWTEWGEEVPPGAIVTDSGLFVPVKDHKLIVRNDTEAELGVTSAGYSTIYHGEKYAEEQEGDEGASMEQIIEAFRNADGSLRFETAGSSRGGKDVWALMYLDEPYKTKGDDTETLPFVAVLNPHGGNGACLVIATMVRVVCWNTFQMALAHGERTGQQFAFRHAGDVKGRIEEAKAALAGVREEADEYRELAADLMKINMDDDRVKMFVSEFLPNPRDNGEVVSDRVVSNVDKARDLFHHIYNDSITTEAVRGTAWGVLQASTEYLDYARAYRSPDTFLGRAILRPEPAKAKALEIVRRVA